MGSFLEHHGNAGYLLSLLAYRGKRKTPLLLLGDGEEPELSSAALKIRREPQIILLGFGRKSKVPPLLLDKREE
jgi:hypothetical protein